MSEFDLEAGGHAVEGFAVDAGGVQDEEDVAALDSSRFGSPEKSSSRSSDVSGGVSCDGWQRMRAGRSSTVITLP